MYARLKVSVLITKSHSPPLFFSILEKASEVEAVPYESVMLPRGFIQNFIVLFAVQSGPTPEELAEMERIETEKRVRCDFDTVKSLGPCMQNKISHTTRI